MLHGEPPFGYKADDLPQRITTGLPAETCGGEGASVGTTGDPEFSRATAQKEVAGEVFDGPEFLPIVRYTLGLVHALISFHVRDYALACICGLGCATGKSATRLVLTRELRSRR